MKHPAWSFTSTILLTLAAIAMGHTAYGAVIANAHVQQMASIEDARIEATLAQVSAALEQVRPALDRALSSVPAGGGLSEAPRAAQAANPISGLTLPELGSPAPVEN
jgi:hypothetical protein